MNTYTNYIDPLNNVMLGYASAMSPAEEIGAVMTLDSGAPFTSGQRCLENTFESEWVCFSDLRTYLDTEDAAKAIERVLSDLIEGARRVLGDSPEVLRVTRVSWVNEHHKTKNPYGTLGFFRFSVVRNPAPKEA